MKNILATKKAYTVAWTLGVLFWLVIITIAFDLFAFIAFLISMLCFYINRPSTYRE